MSDEKALDHMRRRYSKTATVATEHGWELSHELKDDVEGATRLDIWATRGQEKIWIWWSDGKLVVAPDYSFAGVDTKLRNHSAMLQQMASRPEPRAVKRRQSLAQRRGGDALELIEIIRDLPWDPDDLEDRDLLRLCYGKTLIWENKITGRPESDRIKLGDTAQSGPNWNKINYKISYSSAGRRIIGFVGMFGYRSVGVDALLRVM